MHFVCCELQKQTNTLIDFVLLLKATPKFLQRRKRIAKPIKTNIKSSKSSSFPCYLDRIISTTPARRSKYNLDCGEVKLNVTLAIYKTPWGIRVLLFKNNLYARSGSLLGKVVVVGGGGSL